MEKASGVYLTLTDSSFATDGSSVMKFIVPMLTTKGELGLNRVTATNVEEIVGYNPTYNSNYYGLKRILEAVSYVDVWRLNQDAKLANAYFTTIGSTKASDEDVESFSEVTGKSTPPVFAAAALTVGDSGDLAIKLTPAKTISTAINGGATQTDPQEIVLGDCSTTETEVIEIDDPEHPGATKTILSGITIWNSTNSIQVGVVSKEDDGGTTVYKCYKFIDGKLINTPIGTVTFDANSIATMTLQTPFSRDSFWNIRTIPSTITEWVLSVASYSDVDNEYTLLNTYEFSTDPTSEIYWEDVKFGQIQIFIKTESDITTPGSGLREYFTLDNGDNGLNDIIANDVDPTVLDFTDANIILMNGITDYKVVNRIAPNAELHKIHIFADAPAYASYIDVQDWANKIKRSEYIAIGARPDQIDIGGGKYAFVYPSVNYALIFANMYNNYGNLNYPPAGPTYGTIAVENLIKCDYNMYMDELKTNRINWQTSNSSGTMMWEQRTTYANSGDLSYIAPVFIVDAVSEQVVNFERGYNFRYMTPDDLMNQETGLNTILRNFVENGFLYSYELHVPSYAEAQAAGRTLTISIKIVVTKDSEVIQINLNLTN